MPEVSEEYVRIPIIPKEKFKEETFRTIELSDEEGIKAVVGQLKDSESTSMVIHTYLFSLEDGWTVEKAQAWVDAHQKTTPSYHFMEEE